MKNERGGEKMRMEEKGRRKNVDGGKGELMKIG